MSLLKATREFCLAIQNSDEFKNFQAAKEAVLADRDSKERLEKYLELVEKEAEAHKNHTKLPPEEQDQLAKYMKTTAFYPETARFLAAREKLFTDLQQCYKMIQLAVQGKEIPEECNCNDCGCSGDCGSCH